MNGGNDASSSLCAHSIAISVSFVHMHMLISFKAVLYFSVILLYLILIFYLFIHTQ